MYSVGNLKLGQWRKLFNMSISSTLKSWNNFGPWEGIVFEFRSFSRVENLKIQSAGPSPPISGPKWASTGAIGTAPTRHRASHQAVTTLMADRAPTLITAGRRWPTLVHRAYLGVDSSRKESSTHFASSSLPRARLHLYSALLCHLHHLCSPLPATSTPPRRHPSRGKGSLSSPLTLAPGFGPSRWPTTPGNDVHRTTVFFHTGHHRPPCSIPLWLGYYF
jgi:hypothetical protein